MKKMKEEKLRIIKGANMKRINKKDTLRAPRKSTQDYLKNWDLILDTLPEEHIEPYYQIALELFCQSLTNYKKTKEFLKNNGKTYETSNDKGLKATYIRPEVEILSIFHGHVKDSLEMFLLTPESMNKLELDEEFQ